MPVIKPVLSITKRSLDSFRDLACGEILVKQLVSQFNLRAVADFDLNLFSVAIKSGRGQGHQKPVIQ